MREPPGRHPQHLVRRGERRGRADFDGRSGAYEHQHHHHHHGRAAPPPTHRDYHPQGRFGEKRGERYYEEASYREVRQREKEEHDERKWPKEGGGGGGGAREASRREHRTRSRSREQVRQPFLHPVF